MAAMYLYLMCVLVLVYAYRKYKATFDYWKRRNVLSRSVVQSHFQIFSMRENVAIITKKVYNQYVGEKYVGGFVGNIPELTIIDPELVRMITVKDFNYFIDRGLSGNEKGFLSEHLFLLNGERWRTLRHKLTPTFTSSKMRKMFPLIVECSKALEDKTKRSVRDSSEFDIKEIMARYTTDTIGSCAFGLQMNSLSDEESAFRVMGRKIFNVTKKFQIIRKLNEFLPFFKLNPRSDGKEIENFFLNLVKHLIESRVTPSGRPDFMDLMLELKLNGTIEQSANEKMEYYDDAVTEKLEITDEVITAQAFVFFLAGFETSSTTMSHAIWELAFNPDMQNKLHEEIDTVLKAHNGEITYDGVQEMKYLDMVIDETLRKYPPVGILNRVCTSKYKIPNTDIVLDKGVRVVIPILGLHHDPKYFPNPEKFKPERFAPDAEHKHNRFAYLPFGEGPRICIGLRFGKLQTAVGLIAFLRSYSVEPCSRTPDKLRFHAGGLVLQSKGSIVLKVKPRS